MLVSRLSCFINEPTKTLLVVAIRDFRAIEMNFIHLVLVSYQHKITFSRM